MPRATTVTRYAQIRKENENKIKISFFASAVKYHNWKSVLDSLRGGKYPYEVVFSGYLDKDLTEPFLYKYPELKYIETYNIKPAQCYEVARRACVGELVCWIDDDHTFSEGFVDKVYDYWDESWQISSWKKIITTEYIEKDTEENIDNYRFYARNLNTPQMPLVGIMNREYLDSLGGLDSRYIIARWNCDIAMRTLADGGKVVVFKYACVTLDSKNKNGLYNNFWSGWNEDSEQLENSWVIGGYKRFSDPLLVIDKNEKPYWHVPISNQEVTLKRNDEFVPFKDEDILRISQKPVGTWFSQFG